MATNRKVEKAAFAMLTREATVRDIVPEQLDNKMKKAVAVSLAENSCDKPLFVLQSFLNCVFSGATPPPNVLVFIAECLASYFDNAGDLTLDEAFNLQPKQRIGHPLKHQQTKHKRWSVLSLMWQLRKQAERENKVLSIERAAGDAINKLNLENVSEDSLVKSYIEFDADEIFDNAFKAINEFQSTMKQ